MQYLNNPRYAFLTGGVISLTFYFHFYEAFILFTVAVVTELLVYLLARFTNRNR